jgi:hypothetical protein
MADVQVFADGQAKNYMPPIFPYGGIKILRNINVKQDTVYEIFFYINQVNGD